MKLHSFAQKLGFVLVWGIGFFLIPSIQSIKSQSFSPFIAPSPGTSITKSGSVDTLPKSDSLTCDRLTGSMCNLSQSKNETRSIEQLDNEQTNVICGYSGTCSAADFPSIDSGLLQQTIASISAATNSQTVVIYPEITEDQIKILVVLPSGKELRVVTNVKQSELTEVVEVFLNSIRDPSSEDYLPSAQKLYNWLIRPIEAELTGAKAKTLVFVMDGPLRAIPIGALHDGNKFLVQKYATATVPSMRLVIKDLRDDLQLRDRRRSKILIMGLTKAMQGFSALPNVAVETQTALKMFGGNERVFLDEEFTIENLKKQQNANNTNNYDIVHLATHAQFLSNTPEGAFIQFWQKRLSLEDIKTIRLGENKIEMLALSACETAVGQNLGLSGTMLIYRAKSILASLWTVSDAGTPALMLSFYNYYPTAKSKAIAIQQAQLDLLEGRVRIESGQIKGIGNLPAIPLNQTGDINLKHPYFWASFILVGSWL